MDRIEIKAQLSVDDAGAITGIAWPFGSPDWEGDIIEKGAFHSPSRLPMLFAHDQAQAVGLWDSIAEGKDGLQVKGRLLVNDVARAKEVRALVREGAVTGLSIGFVSKRSAPRAGGGRTITQLELHEISIVPVPSHPGARVETIKGKRMTKVVQKEEGVVEEATIEDRVGTLETDVAALKTDVAAIKGGTEEAAKTLKSIETKLARPGIVKRTEDKDEAAELEKKSFGIYLRRGDKAMTEAEIKTLRVSNDPSGGYLAPPEFNSEFIKELIEFSPIRPIASVRSTTSPSVIYPVRTAITNAKWKGEIETREASEPAFGEAEVDVKELTTYVPISNQLLADSGGAAEREVRAALADDFGQKESTAFVNGDGVKAPEGFMTNASVPITVNGHASNLSADALITLMYAVQAAYRNKGTWVMNGNTLATIRKLKDGQNNYLWQPAFTEGQPETILGRPVVDAIDMPEATSGLFPIAFGDFDAAYRIVDRESMSILVDPYTQATNGITRFHASRRVGGKVIRPKAIRKLKMATS